MIKFNEMVGFYRMKFYLGLLKNYSTCYQTLLDIKNNIYEQIFDKI